MKVGQRVKRKSNGEMGVIRTAGSISVSVKLDAGEIIRMIHLDLHNYFEVLLITGPPCFLCLKPVLDGSLALSGVEAKPCHKACIEKRMRAFGTPEDK